MRVDCQTPVVDDYQESTRKSMGQRVNDLFELESPEITELDSVHETFIKDIKFENNHYTVKLPWREYQTNYWKINFYPETIAKGSSPFS